MSLTLSIVVPVYNESPHLRQLVEHLLAAPCPIQREWIFVDDHSTDGSYQVLQELSEKHQFLLIRHPENRGKGAALKMGISKATGDFIMIQDADYEYDPSDVPRLLQPLLDNKADVVYGSRFKKSGEQVHRTFHYFVNKSLTFLSNIFSGIYLTDMETCYKVFRCDLLQSMNLRSPRFGFEVECTAYLAKLRLPIYEIPISYYPRRRLQGKKIGWKDGFAALFHLVRFNFFTSVKSAYYELPERYRSDAPPRLLSFA